MAGIAGTGLQAHSERPVPLTVMYYAAFIGLGISSASLGPTLPGLAEQTSSTLTQVSILFSSRWLGYLVGTSAGGRLYDRSRQGHRLMAAGVAGMAACLALVPFLHWLSAVAAALLVLGMSEGLMDVGANTLLVRAWQGKGRIDPLMNALHFFFGLGAFFSPILVAQALLATAGISWAYWFLAALMIPVAIWLLVTPTPHTPELAHAENGRISIGAMLLTGFILFFALFVGVEASMGGWIYTYALTTGLALETGAAYLTSAFWGAFTVGRLAGVPIAARVAPQKILLTDLMVCLAGIGIIGLWQASPAALWAGTMMIGAGVASMFPTGLVFLQQWIPLTGKVTGLMFFGATGGSIILPWLIGQAFNPFGPAVLLAAVGGSLVGSMLLFSGLMLAARKKRRLVNTS